MRIDDLAPLPLDSNQGDLRCGLQRCYHGPVPAGGNRLAHRDPVMCAWALEQGSMSLRWAGGSLQGRVGDLILVPAGLDRDQQFSPDAQLVSLRLWVFRSDGAPPFVTAQPCRAQGGAAALRQAMVALAAAEAASPAPDPAIAAEHLALLAQAVACWYRCCVQAQWQIVQQQRLDPRLAAAMALLQQWQQLGALPWPELSAVSGLSRRQLDRLWLQSLGQSPARWHEQRLAAQAWSLLRDGTRPIKAVAQACGCRDVSHFVRWYRRLHGLSPGQHRRLQGPAFTLA